MDYQQRGEKSDKEAIKYDSRKFKANETDRLLDAGNNGGDTKSLWNSKGDYRWRD